MGSISYTGGVILSCLAMLLIIAMINEAWTRYRGRHIISRRHFILRLTTGLLLLGAIAGVFVAAVLPVQSPWTALALWTIPLVLAVTALALAFLDRRWLARLRQESTAALYSEMVRLQQELLSRKSGKPSS